MKKFKPSVIAASIVFCARKIFGLQKTWPEEIAEITGHFEHQLEEPTRLLLENL